MKFNGFSFSNWKLSTILSLSAKNKLGFVEGSITKPDVTSADRKPWEICNDLVCSWIISNLDDIIAKSVLFLKTFKEIWNDLEESFSYNSMTQLYSIEQQLYELNQVNDKVSEFFTMFTSVGCCK